MTRDAFAQCSVRADASGPRVSLEGYGRPVIDWGMVRMRTESVSDAATSSRRMIRDRPICAANIDDGESSSASSRAGDLLRQSTFVTVGNIVDEVRYTARGVDRGLVESSSDGT